MVAFHYDVKHYFRVRGFLRATPLVASDSSAAALAEAGLPALAALAALAAFVALVTLVAGTLGGLPAAAAWACASSRTVLATLQNSGP